MEDDESLERQRQSIAAEVEALEDATGVTKQNELKKKASAFHESMSQLKEQRLGLLKQRAHLTQEMEKRGFSVRDAEEASTSYSSADASKRKFAARENLISRLIDDSRSSQRLIDRLKSGESVSDAKRHVEQEARREAEKKEEARREREAQELREAKKRAESSQRKREKEAKAEKARSGSKLGSRRTRRRSSSREEEDRGVGQQEAIPAYIRDIQAQIQALQASLASAKGATQGAAEAERPARNASRPAEEEEEEAMEYDADLPKPIQKDSEMIRLHQSHMRDMIKLQYEIERAQREVELEKMRTEISKLRDEKDNFLKKISTPLRPTTRGERSANDGPEMEWIERPENVDVIAEVTPRANPRFTPGRALALEGPSPTTGLGSVGPAIASSPAPPLAENHTISIQMNRMATTNFMLQGKVRVTAQFYDGVQLRNEALSSGAQDGEEKTTSTSYVFPVYNEGSATNYFTWRDKLTISGVQIGPASQVVLEIQTILEVEKDEGEEEEAGWDKLKKMYSKKSTFNLPQVVCWAVIPLVNAATNEHIEGHQTIPVYHLPKILGEVGKQSAMKGTSLELEVNITKEKIGKVKTPKSNLEKRRMSNQSSAGPDSADQNQGAGDGRKQLKSRDVSTIPPEAWLRSRHALRSLETFQPGDGFVIRVDAGRFFPENVTVTKITVRFLTSEREQVGDNIESIGSLDTSAYFPRYRLRCFVNTEMWDDPTVMALLTVETLEKTSEDFCVVGYGCLPLFVDPDTEKQPKLDHAGDYTLRSGSYQIPLHNCLPPQEASARAFSKEMDRNKNDLQNTKVALSSFDLEAFEENCPRISCASLLVRILTAEEDDLIMLRGDRLPEYGSREYDTRQTEPIECEKLMYSFKLKTRSFLSTSELLKKSFFSDDEVEAIEDDEREGGSMLMEWVKSRLQRPDLKNDVMLNYSHSFTYFDKLGFSVAVDGAKNLVKGLPAFAFISLNPPGAYYESIGRGAGTAQVTEDVAFTFRHNPKSKAVCPVWDDGFVRFPFVPYDPHLCVIIEVRYWNARSSRLTTIGWTALPVFYKGQKGEQYVCTGYYNLPLFMGSPPYSFLENMWTTHFPELARSALDQARLRIAKEAPSVLVRIVDNQREGEVAEPATEPKMKGKVKIPHFVPSKYSGAMHKESRGRKLYEKMKPRKIETYVEWRAEMAEQVSLTSGVAYAKEELAAEVEEEKSKIESEPPSPAKSVASTRAASRAASRAESRPASAASTRKEEEESGEEESEYSDEESEEEKEN